MNCIDLGQGGQGVMSLAGGYQVIPGHKSQEKANNVWQLFIEIFLR